MQQLVKEYICSKETLELQCLVLGVLQQPVPTLQGWGNKADER